MTLRHLTIFIKVCECGSITKAAEKLFLAQPAVSLAISELEKYYGIHLFDRISRKLYITQAGKQFLDYALHITGLYKEMETEMKNWDSIGSLHIGSSITIGTHFLPKYVEVFSHIYPEIKVHITVNNSKNIENMVLNNEVDFALIEGVLHTDRLIAESFLEDELVLVCGMVHPLSAQTKISLDELTQQTFLLREPESGTRELFDSTLLTYGVSIEPSWESVSTGAIIQALIKGFGLSALPYYLVKDLLDSKLLHRLYLQNIDFKRKFHIIYHKNKYLTKSALAFLEICKDSSHQ
ncbi:MAG: LysR family transcriptional regulator [Clostridiales bacterium]|jgi:DNA-binding transcriptional LysR family regulator|nr:LysR family transcriptional regulator [Clostridiales bacterium]